RRRPPGRRAAPPATRGTGRAAPRAQPSPTARRPSRPAWFGLDPRSSARRPSHRLGDQSAGGRKPNVWRIACPSGPASQSRNAWAVGACADAFTTTPAYVAGTFAVSGIATVATLVDARASVA